MKNFNHQPLFLHSRASFSYYRLINLLQNCEKHFKQDKPPVHDVNRWLFEPQVIFYEQKMTVSRMESTYKKCLREEWGKFTGYQLLSIFWLKVARTDEDGNTTRWDRGTLPIRNLYPKWGMLRFGRIKKVTNWIWMLWFIVSY